MDFFDRQRRLAGFGDAAQEKLKDAAVLIAGVGGLGCPVALYLAAAGVGKILLVDGDKVSLTNLHRQILFGVKDVGQFKAQTAAEKLSEMYPHCSIHFYNEWVQPENLMNWLPAVDVVVDATDNFPSRFLLNDAARDVDKPLVHGSVIGFEGLLSVFHYPDAKQGFDFRDFLSDPPAPDEVPTCGEEGVLGVVPGVIGTLMAAEVIKILSNTGIVLSGTVKHFDLRTQQWYDVQLRKNDSGLQEKKWEVEQMIRSDVKGCNVEVRQVSGSALVIDVREPDEVDENDPIKGLNIPMGELRRRADEWSSAPEIHLFCQTGSRSGRAIRIVQELAPEVIVTHLEGGIEMLKINNRP